VASLDTSVLIDLMRNPRSDVHRRVVSAVTRLRASSQPICTTRLNVAELYVGVELAHDTESERQSIAEVLQELPVLEFDDRAARAFAAITAHLQRLGRPVGDMDALIAAIALTNGQSLLTRNPRHFTDMPGVVVNTY